MTTETSPKSGPTRDDTETTTTVEHNDEDDDEDDAYPVEETRASDLYLDTVGLIALTSSLI